MDMNRDDDLLDNCLASIRALSPVLTVRYSPARPRGRTGEPDGDLTVALGRPHGRLRYSVHTSRAHLSYALVDGLLSHLQGRPQPQLLFALYIAAPMGQYLADHHLSYADTVGNLHLVSPDGRGLIGHVEGKSLQHTPSVRGLGLPAHQVNFALLAKPALLKAPIREIAEAAGASKSSVANQLGRLSTQGFLVKTREGAKLVRPRELLDRWLSAYVDVVRPRWLVGRFHPQADVEALERSLPGALAGQTWALGGGSAAWRMTHFYRGEETVLHVVSAPQDLAKRLKALPSESGRLSILKVAMPLAFEGGEPNLAHPLLVYSEMLASLDPRMRDAAAGVRERYLSELA